jgi:hypothetical protein
VAFKKFLLLLKASSTYFRYQLQKMTIFSVLCIQRNILLAFFPPTFLRAGEIVRLALLTKYFMVYSWNFFPQPSSELAKDSQY